VAWLVIYQRKNPTSADPKSPHFQNPPTSELTVAVPARTAKRAVQKAEAFWKPTSYWDPAFKVLSVDDMDD
jgi:hypothetical protein